MIVFLVLLSQLFPPYFHNIVFTIIIIILIVTIITIIFIIVTMITISITILFQPYSFHTSIPPKGLLWREGMHGKDYSGIDYAKVIIDLYRYMYIGILVCMYVCGYCVYML